MNDASEHRLRALDLFYRHELFGGMRERDIARSKANRRDARFIEESRVGPCRKPFDPYRHSFASDRVGEPRYHRRIDRNIAGELRRPQCNARVEIGAARLYSRARVGDLEKRLLDRLAGNRPPLDCQVTTLRIGGHPNAPVDCGGME